MIIAIDGPAGVGKSSIAKECAQTFALQYINSGLLYRIITLQKIEHTAPDNNMYEIGRQDFVQNAAILYDLYTQHMKDKLRYQQCYSKRVDDCVGQISTIAQVRDIVNKTIILLERGSDHCIVEGRDITSVVHCDADLKIYLDATIEVRAQRRSQQNGENYHQILHGMQVRDNIDLKKSHGKLAIVKDAHIIDTTHLTFLAACVIVKQYTAQLLCQD